MQDEEPTEDIEEVEVAPVSKRTNVPKPEMPPMPADGLAAAEALTALRQGKPLQDGPEE